MPLSGHSPCVPISDGPVEDVLSSTDVRIPWWFFVLGLVPPPLLVVLDVLGPEGSFRPAALVWALSMLGVSLWLLFRRSPRPPLEPSVPSGLDVTVVFNPSKAVDPVARREEVLASLARHAPRRVRWLETTLEDPGTLACRGALEEGTDLVLACGGDGTVMACATALVGSKIPLAVLPSGTGNLLATHLQLSSLLDEAVDVAFSGERVRVDVGWCADRAFLVMAGIGFDAQMVGEASPTLKRHAGWLAYVVSGSRHLFDRPSSFEVTVDGVTTSHWGKGVLVANVGTLSGGMQLLPAAAFDDGLLDVAVLSPRGVLGWVRLGGRLLARSRRPSGELQVRQGREVSVRSSRPLPFDVDGDALGVTRELSVSLRPRSLTLMRPLA